MFGCWKRRALAAEKEIAATKAELAATGHRHAGDPLHILVDKAIDAERCRKERDLRDAAEAARMAVYGFLPYPSLPAKDY